MKRSSLVLAALVLGVGLFSSIGSHAASPCGTGARNAQDPFGSCEENSGKVHCDATATDVGGVFKLDQTATGGQGVEGCAGGADALPVHGRAGVYVSSANDATIFIDGDDSFNAAGAGGWDRVDVKHGGQVCFNRGSGGTYWTTGGGHSNADAPPMVGCAP